MPERDSLGYKRASLLRCRDHQDPASSSKYNHMGRLWDVLIRGVPNFCYRLLSGEQVARRVPFAEELQPTLAESPVLTITEKHRCTYD